MRCENLVSNAILVCYENNGSFLLQAVRPAFSIFSKFRSYSHVCWMLCGLTLGIKNLSNTKESIKWQELMSQ